MRSAVATRRRLRAAVVRALIAWATLACVAWGAGVGRVAADAAGGVRVVPGAAAGAPSSLQVDHTSTLRCVSPARSAGAGANDITPMTTMSDPRQALLGDDYLFCELPWDGAADGRASSPPRVYALLGTVVVPEGLHTGIEPPAGMHAAPQLDGAAPPQPAPSQSETLLSFAEWREQHLESERRARHKQRDRGRGDAHETVLDASQHVPAASQHVSAASPAPSAPAPLASTGGADPQPSAAPPVPPPTAERAVPQPYVYAQKDAPATLAELRHRWNYASLDCAAVVHQANPSAKFAAAILSEKKDRYMLSPCASSMRCAQKDRACEGQFVVVELCQHIRVDTLVLANLEFFSSMFKLFRVRVAASLHASESDWHELGMFRAQNVRSPQVFRLEAIPESYFRFLRIDFLEHYGTEYYCPVSLLRVYGRNEREDADDDMRDDEDALDVEGDGVWGSADEAPRAPDAVAPEKGARSAGTAERENVRGGARAAVDGAGPHSGSAPPTASTSADAPLPSICVARRIPMLRAPVCEWCGPPCAPSAPTSSAVVGAPPTGTVSPTPTARTMSPTGSAPDASTRAADTAPGAAPAPTSTLTADVGPPPPVPTTPASTAGNRTAGGADRVADGAAAGGAEGAAAARSANAAPAAMVTCEGTSVAGASAVPSDSAARETPGGVSGETERGASAAVSAVSTGAASPAPSSSPASNTATGTSTRTTRSSSKAAASGAPGSGGGSESIFRTITKRLNALESNTSLSMQYLQMSSELLRDKLAVLEENHEARVYRLLTALNASNAARVAETTQQYDRDLRRALFEVDMHRQRSDMERMALLARVQRLTDEILYEKRWSVAQLLLLLLLLVLLALTRSSVVTTTLAHAAQRRPVRAMSAPFPLAGDTPLQTPRGDAAAPPARWTDSRTGTPSMFVRTVRLRDENATPSPTSSYAVDALERAAADPAAPASAPRAALSERAAHNARRVARGKGIRPFTASTPSPAGARFLAARQRARTTPRARRGAVDGGGEEALSFGGHHLGSTPPVAATTGAAAAPGTAWFTAAADPSADTPGGRAPRAPGVEPRSDTMRGTDGGHHRNASHASSVSSACASEWTDHGDAEYVAVE
ncbi:hypothetical protein MSPP1_003659 [Malassezia sp. CBS 17886]|nr:hypothetical protein MSPP1_003659 [Malassezia sp. CBS 17886]